jgi:hypothetical protein
MLDMNGTTIDFLAGTARPMLGGKGKATGHHTQMKQKIRECLKENKVTISVAALAKLMDFVAEQVHALVQALSHGKGGVISVTKMQSVLKKMPVFV